MLERFGIMDTQAIDDVTFDFKGTPIRCFVGGSTDYQMDFSLVRSVSKWSIVDNVKVSMKYVHTFGTGRHQRQADITLLFEYTCNSFVNYMWKFWIDHLIGRSALIPQSN